MSASVQLTLQEWRNSRVRQVRVAGIDIRLRVVSTRILDECGPDLQDLLNEVNDMHRRINGLPIQSRGHLDDAVAALLPVPTRREFASAMRKALDLILPYVLDSPDWLPQALDDFSESEIIELYNVVMHGAGAPAAMPS